MKRAIRILTFFIFAAIILALVFGLSCEPGKNKTPRPAETTVKKVKIETVSEAKAPEPLSVKISPSGELHELPTSVVVRFSRPVSIEDMKTGSQLDPEKILKIRPHTKGKLYFKNKNTIIFKPEQPFAFSTTYTVELLLKETDKGGLILSGPGPWKTRFSTPPFILRKVVLKKADKKSRETEVLLIFSGPVSAKSFREHLEVKINNRRIGKFEVVTLDRPEEVLVKTKLTRISHRDRLRVKVNEGVRSRDGTTQTEMSYERAFKPAKPKAVRISSVYLKEGANGHFLEVTCYDYSEERYWNRCDIPVEALRETVHINPPVGATFIPERRGWRIFGDFQLGDYSLTIEAGLKSRNGGVLTRTYTKKISVPLRTRKATFATKGRYLPRHRLGAVPIKHINVENLKIIVRRIPERNLVYWLSGSRERADDRTSDIIASKKFKVEKRRDEELTTWVDLSELVSTDARGVFEFSLYGGSSTDAIRLVLTQLTLVAKRAGPKGRDLWVWVLDSEKLTPREGAVVELLTTSNRVLTSGIVDAQGLARFENVADPIKTSDKAPFAIVARTGDDLTALKFADLELELSEYPVRGTPYRAGQPYRAAIYTDRGVYRPGETVHLVSIVWEKGNRAPDKALPVIGYLRDTRGKEVERLSGRTNTSGMVSFDFHMQDYARTGKYSFVLKIGGKKVAQHSFLVEEFMPERLKVKVSPTSDGVTIKEPAQFKVEARYLFGAMAAGERVEATCTLEQGNFELDKYPGYSFDVWRPEPFRPLPLGKISGRLDDKGVLTVNCAAVSDITTFIGPGKVTVMVSVFEAGSGRVSVARSSMPIHPERFYVGLKTSATGAKVGRSVEVEGAVVNWDGELVQDLSTVVIELLEIQSEWVWEHDPNLGRSTWRRFLREVTLGEDDVTVKEGRFTYAFVPSHYSYGFIVRARAGEVVQADLYLRGEGYSWWWDGGYSPRADRTPKPSVPVGLKIDAPALAEVGKPTEVAITLPYPGRLLFTVETDEVLEWRWIDVEGGPFTTTFTLDKFAPNIYVSALLIKNPFYESSEAFIPGRAFGVRSVRVKPEQNEFALKLTLPEEVQPNRELVIELDAGVQTGPLFATVAAVDEGILQLTDFKSPDPLRVMFKKRGLGVRTFETVGWTLLMPPFSGSDSTGGGEGAEEDGEGRKKRNGAEAPGRIHPIKPVALWSGLIEMGPDGKAKVKFDVPTYRGELRVMAVAAGISRIGRASAPVKVRDPLVLQPTFPRFLTAKDKFVVPVFLTNLTGHDEKVEIALKTGEGVQIEDAATKSISLAKGASGTVTFLCRAVAAFGAAEFEVVATGSETVSRDKARIPLLPSGSVIQDIHVTQLRPGKNDLTKFLKGWMPQYEQTIVTVMPNRYAEELNHLKYLVRYPYGCVEQTSSSMRPLLYIGNLVSMIDPEILKKGSIEDRFMHGVNKLFNMQTSNGGFAYWPGGENPTYWGTAYATHILLEGIEAGYPISKYRVDEAVNFIKNTLTYKRNYEDRKRGYSVTNSEPYLHFVLAKAGKGRPGRIRRLIKNPNKKWGGLKEENMFLLKAALYLSGDRTYEKDLQEVPLEISDKRINGWAYWSDLRTKGLMLNIMEDLFPKSETNELLAQSIAKRLKQRSGYYTTQELAWCVSALGKRAAGGAKSWSEPILSIDGHVINPLPAPKKDSRMRSWQIAGASRARQFSLRVDSINDGRLYALVRVEGLKPGVPPVRADKYLKVRRRYLTADGKPVDTKHIHLGDLVYVELTLANLTNMGIQNVAVVDRFGAGLEIENPHLKRKHMASWINTTSIWKADYSNMRDDRIEIFGRLNPKETVTAVYILRATLGGKFSTPPLRAEVMYEPRQFSQQPGAPVTIIDAWGALTD